MTDFSQSDWRENDVDNTGIAPNGLQGGDAPSKVAPTIRAIRGALKRNYVRQNPKYTTSGGTNAYVLTYEVAQTAYVKDEKFSFYAHANNTGPATLNINGLGAKPIVSQHGSPLTANQIAALRVIEAVYDGTSFVLIGNETHDSKFTGSFTIDQANTQVLMQNGGIELFRGDGAPYIDFKNNLADDYDARIQLSGNTGLAFTGTNFDFGGTANFNANQIVISGTSPHVKLADSTAAQGDIFLYADGGTFYVLADRNNDGTWETPHPLALASTNNTAQIFGYDVWTTANFDPNTKLNTSGNQTMSGALNTTGDLSTSGSIFANSGNAYIQSSSNRHLWFRTNTGVNRGLLYHADSGSLNLQLYNSAGTFVRRATFAEGGEFYIQGSLKTDGNVVVGSATYLTDGNITFAAGMLGHGSNLYNALNNKVSVGGRAYPIRVGGVDINFNWSGQAGQPSWLWGGNDGTNMYVYNPSNFNVNYANGAYNADVVDGYHAIDLAQIYKGTNSGETNLPIGTIITAYGAVGNLHQTYVLRIGSSQHYLTDGWGGGAVMSGTWRHRGFVSSDGSYQTSIYQRVA